ncbi:hypothetical protein GCM10023322_09250 [Rugosimonospora acidiphila]|uniref:Uncharacterized protein n=1 Tax=Rugosimonospora acidiphila TaxID=556531 RepID=A0ABP9RK78_9ACTN
MLVTFTCEPPSWPARLPQKFSAATTLMVVEPPEVVEALDEVEQPASARTASAAAPAADPIRRLRKRSGMDMEDTASLRADVSNGQPDANENHSRFQMR